MADIITTYDLRKKRKPVPRIFRVRERIGPSAARLEAEVTKIVEAVAARGDAAVAEFTKEFDGVALSARRFEIKKNTISRALSTIDRDVRRSLEKALENIRKFHKITLPRSEQYSRPDGVKLGERITPIARVGVHVPGGKAFYPSTVLMAVVPAKVAGCDEVVLVSPPSYNGTIHPAILAAAGLAGADRVFRIGGAQAIAALAYGTKTVPAVDKIVGPGNRYVSAAKRVVSHTADIDKEAGPSEIVIIADKSARPRWVAADMLSQAEHDEEAVAILLTDSARLARDVATEIEQQVEESPRKLLVAKALKSHGAIVLASDLTHAVELADMRAPEHLALMVEKPASLLKLVRNAGAIFLGPYSPVAVGDYIAGPSHVLPTAGTARFASALTVNDFLKRSSVIAYTKKRLVKEADHIVRLAETEGLQAHAESVKMRVR